MKPKKVLFLEGSGGGGHISITTAIIQGLKKLYPEIECVRSDVAPILTHKFYQLASRQFNSAYLLLYKVSNNHSGEVFASKVSSAVIRDKLRRVINDAKPDLVFSDFPFAIGDVPKIIEDIQTRLPFIVFVPDPFTFHNIYLSKGVDKTLVSTLTAYCSAIKRGVKPESLAITGHPVREEFLSKPTDTAALRQRLGLDTDAFTLFFGGSGYGAEKTLEILIHLGTNPSGALIRKLIRNANLNYKTYYNMSMKFFNRKTKNLPLFQAVCVCGDNTDLKEALEMLEFPDYILPRIFLKPKSIADLIHASDIVVGKAGPNIIFESVLAGKPFLATHHIKGQEDGNIDFIRSTQCGFVEENPQNMASLIESILYDKNLLNFTKNGIEYIQKEHREASKNIAKQIGNYLA